jgi:hypothetical protein
LSEAAARRERERDRALGVYANLAQLVGRLADPPSPAPGDLTRYELRVFSQNGEDGVLCELLRRAGRVDEASFVEFGIGTGAQGNCVFGAEVLGWRGLFIEPSDEYAALERRWQARSRVATARALVTPETVNAIFRDHDVPEEPDVVSIDIDGNDYWVWEALDFRPRVMVVEYNGNLDTSPDVRLVQPYEERAWDNTDYFGASLGALESLGRRKGYRLAHTELAGVNAFFVRDDVDAGLSAPEEVPRRRVNLRLTGRGHPPDPSGREYVTVD